MPQFSSSIIASVNNSISIATHTPGGRKKKDKQIHEKVRDQKFGIRDQKFGSVTYLGFNNFSLDH